MHGSLVYDGGEHGRVTRTSEWPDSSRQFEQRYSQAEDVALRRCGLAQYLLGRQVLHGARNNPRNAVKRRRRIGSVPGAMDGDGIGRLRQPEIQDFDEPVGPYHHVLRLDVADRKSTRLNSSHLGISYAVFCL